MTLRGRIFALFLALAAGPLIVLALLVSRAVSGAVHGLVAEQVQQLAERSATVLARRHALHRSDMLLLADNDETQRLLRGPLSAAQRDTVAQYLVNVWAMLREQYHAVAIVDGAGVVQLMLGDTVGAQQASIRTEAVRDRVTGNVIGAVRSYVRPGAFLPVSELETRFGDSGEALVIERASGKLVYPVASGASAASAELQTLLGDSAAPIRYRDQSGARIGYHAPVATAGMSVVVSSAVSDFAAPFDRLSRIMLFTIVAVMVLATIAFLVLLSRATRSLRALTLAADDVGRGDFAPELPHMTRDDVGHLTEAFGLMVTKIRDMLVRVESSRQMAVLGEFAARLSHEVRNPLTAIKLNLQSLDRDARAKRINAQDAVRPLSIALREIDRLDDVLTRVLELARSQPSTPRSIPLQSLATEVQQLVAEQASRHGVELRIASRAQRDDVYADPAELKGALLNLVLNALDAAPTGTAIEIDLSNDEQLTYVQLRIRDHGAGVPAGLREDVFRPFFTTKPDGTGLGLSIARRSARELGGDLTLEDTDGAGAAFVLSLPLADVAADTTMAHAVVGE